MRKSIKQLDILVNFVIKVHLLSDYNVLHTNNLLQQQYTIESNVFDSISLCYIHRWYQNEFRAFLNDFRQFEGVKCAIFFSILPSVHIKKSTNRSLEKNSPSFRALLDPQPMHKMWEIVALLVTFFPATHSSRPLCIIFHYLQKKLYGFAEST